MREHLVHQGVDPAEAARAADAWKNRHSLGGDHDPARFRRDLGLPDDPQAMTLDQLDQLIAYHDSLCERYDAALDRVIAVRELIEAVGVNERELVGEPPRIDNSPLFEAWADASAEYSWCQTEVQAVGAYAEPLLPATALPSRSPGSERD